MATVFGWYGEQLWVAGVVLAGYKTLQSKRLQVSPGPNTNRCVCLAVTRCSQPCGYAICYKDAGFHGQDPRLGQKIYQIDKHVLVAVTGVIADAMALVGL